ncbi:DUF3558 domain-containing protein [Nocardia puris]|uniref:DUF3558 domain-containing protein n=1 Tax=Nocardia puris TaxID=208602 RepID=UPI001E2F3EC7|nr:DUF3558 domain-containing protein [Nocardia puris]
MVGGTSRGAVRLAAVGVAAVAVLAGCSSTVDGTATEQGQGSAPTSHDESIPLFNPCTDLSDEVLAGADLDPASKQVTVDRQDGPPSWWKICDWDSTDGPYGVSIFSTRRTVEERRSNERSRFVRDVTIGTRAGVVTTNPDDPDELTCHVSIPAAQGMFELGITWLYGEPQPTADTPPCDLAVRHMEYFEPHLPA